MKIELVDVPGEQEDENDKLRKENMRLKEGLGDMKRYMRLVGCAVPPEWERT
jgi:hypothetical protein